MYLPHPWPRRRGSPGAPPKLGDGVCGSPALAVPSPRSCCAGQVGFLVFWALYGLAARRWTWLGAHFHRPLPASAMLHEPVAEIIRTPLPHGSEMQWIVLAGIPSGWDGREQLSPPRAPGRLATPPCVDRSSRPSTRVALLRYPDHTHAAPFSVRTNLVRTPSAVSGVASVTRRAGTLLRGHATRPAILRRHAPGRRARAPPGPRFRSTPSAVNA